MSTNIYDRIEELSLAELEKLILSYWNNGKSSLITNQDDLESCLRKRCCLLPPCHVDNHLDDIARLNTLLTKTALKLLDEADRIYRHVKNILQLPYRGPCKISPSRMGISKMSETARLLQHFGENLQLFGLT